MLLALAREMLQAIVAMKVSIACLTMGFNHQGFKSNRIVVAVIPLRFLCQFRIGEVFKQLVHAQVELAFGQCRTNTIARTVAEYDIGIEGAGNIKFFGLGEIDRVVFVQMGH